MSVVFLGIVIIARLNVVDAVKCYSCSGKTDDGLCGTPFHGADLQSCDGSACTLSRTIVEFKQGELQIFCRRSISTSLVPSFVIESDVKVFMLG